MNPAPHTTLSRRAVLASSAGGTALAGCATNAAPTQSADKAPFVLLHPAWLGGWAWKKLTPLLRAEGHDVYTPTLTGLGERTHLVNRDISLATHVEDIVSVLENEDLRAVILVGNSSGGMVITGVAERAPERIAQLVYLDAFVPEDGQSLVDLLSPERRQAFEELVRTEGQGWLMPRFSSLPAEQILREGWGVTSDADVNWMLPRLRPTPYRHFTDRVARANPAAQSISRTYIRCRQFQQRSGGAFDRHADMAQATSGWRYREMATPHLPYVTHPNELASILIELAGQPAR